MEVFEIFVNEQRYTVYPDEWEDGIHQVKVPGGVCRFLRNKPGIGWEELDPASLDAMIGSDQTLTQLLGNRIEDKLPDLFPREMLVITT